MTFKYGAIPTEYRGIRFRSRTEARWAAFFDEVGWSWQYEPYDLAGWIPDFALEFDTTLLVEVKPASNPVDLFDRARELDETQARHFDGEILLLGSHPMEVGRFRPWHFPEMVGSAQEMSSWQIEWLSALAPYLVEAAYKSRAEVPAIGLVRRNGRWTPSAQRVCETCGALDTAAELGAPFRACGHSADGARPASRRVLDGAFSTAQNSTQWKGRR